MGKVLKVLVVLLLLLNIAALFFASQLFGARELLKAREDKLRDAVTAMASFIEDEPEAAEDAPAAKSLASEMEGISQDLQTTSRTKIWDGYNLSLEETDRPKASVSARDLKPETPAALKKSGAGSMSDTLTELQEKAKSQMEHLTDTRIQLKTLREEYVATIQELDKKAKDLAAAEGTLAKHELKIEEMEGQMHPLREEKEALETSMQEMQATMEEQTTEMDNLARKLTEATDEIAALNKKAKEAAVVQAPSTGSVQQASVHIEPGFKGRVAYFDPTWNFVVLELHENFIKEVLGDEMKRALPEGIELMIYRQGDKGAFVTKVVLSNIRVSEGVGVADVVPGWNDKKWFPVREGDGAFF